MVLCICFLEFPNVSAADDYYIQWADTIDNGGWDGAFGIAVDNANNVVVAGCSFIGGNNDYFVVKYDSNGAILWQDTIDNGAEDYAEAVTIDNANNIIVTGYCTIGGDYDYFTAKYDANGTILWQDTIDNSGLYDIARGVAVDNSNNIIVTGYSDIGGNCVYFTVKYDSNGTILWTDTLGSSSSNSAFGVAVDNVNNIIVTGYISNGVNNDYFTVKFDSNGLILWQDTIDICQFDQAYGVAVDNADNIIVTGCSGESFDDYDYFTVKYDSSGTIIWQDIFDNNDHEDVAYHVAVDDCNNVYVTGYSLALSGDYDYFIIKYDPNGAVLWKDSLDNGHDDIAQAIAVDNSHNIIATGKSSIAGDFDYFTVKYAPITCIFEDDYSDRSINNQIFYDIHPNPFNEKTEIKFQFPADSKQKSIASIKIYDIIGQLVKSFKVATNYSLLSNSLSWNGCDAQGKEVPCGVYFINLDIENHNLTRKAILMR